jgi:hypothetical protein
MESEIKSDEKFNFELIEFKNINGEGITAKIEVTDTLVNKT